MNFYCLGYGSFNGWIATLGQTPEQKLDEKTGKEDLTEQRQVGAYFRSWRPYEVWFTQPICLHFKARGRKRHNTDLIFHNAVGPFISEHAAEIMRPLLKREGHILPLDA